MSDSRESRPDLGTLALIALAIIGALLIWAMKPAPHNNRRRH